MHARWLLLGTVFGTVLTASAGDWPQWRGPNRDGVTDFTAPKTWPKALTKKWSVPVGHGVSTPALVGGKLYVFSWEDPNEVLRCLDADTGNEIWKDSYKTTASGGPSKGYPAARSSPAVSGGKVVTMGVQGVLSCLDAAGGKVVWRKDKTGGAPGFSASCSPLLVDGLCVVQVGGDRGGAVVAYDLATGDEKWRWGADGTKYASPTLLTVGGTKAVVVETAGTVSALSLDAGKLLWQTSFTSRYNASTPVVAGDMIVFGGSATANKAVKVEKDGDKLAAKDLWSNKDNTVIYNTPTFRDGMLIGVSERNEAFAIDAASGKTLWAHALGEGGKGGRGGGYGSVVSAGPVVFVLTPAGSLVVLEPRKDEYKELARYKVADRGTYAYPIVSGNRVYVKDENAVTLWVME